MSNSSAERNPSAVRNLRSLFENNDSETNSNLPRGRSPGGVEINTPSRPQSKVRVSFVPVHSNMATTASDATLPDLSQQPSHGRRAGHSEDQGSDGVDALKDTAQKEGDRRDQDSTVVETVRDGAVETPLVEVEVNKEISGGKEAKVAEKPAENPDKPVTGAQEEPAGTRPAQPTYESAVKVVGTNLQAKSSTATAVPKPASVSTKTTSKPASSSTKSPKAPVAKSSRASLTAPTAASVARAAAAAERSAVPAAKPAAPKPKPREVTKPSEISSRLTAPTAASRARRESGAAAESKPAVTRSKPAATSSRSHRPSLGQPESRNSQGESKRPAAPVSGSFLERMTRPTAASSSRLSEKTADVKSAVKQKLPLRPKTNGHSKKVAPQKSEAAPDAIDDEPSVMVEDGDAADPIHEVEAAAVAEGEPVPHKESIPVGVAEAPEANVKPVDAAVPTGNETPIPHTNGHSVDALGLEDTPAALSEDALR